MTDDLLVIGEAFEDFVFYDLPRLPELGEEIKTESFRRTVGGGVVITATAARRLGTSTRVTSAFGETVERHLAREGIPFRNLRRPGESAALTVAMSTARERAFVTCEGVNLRLEERLLECCDRDQARHVHAALAPRDPRAWTKRVSDVRRSGATVSWDFGWNPQLDEDREAFVELLESLDVLFINEAEAKLYARASDLESALTFYAEHGRRTLVKRGASGAVWVEGNRRGTCPAPAVRALDTTGAGDAFDGGYLHAFLEGLPLEECLRIANAVGALSTRGPGGVDALPRREELP